MAKLKGKAKAKFLARMKKGRLAKAAKRATKNIRKIRSRKPKSATKRRKSQSTNTRKTPRKVVAKRKFTARAKSGFASVTKNKFVRGAVLGLGGAALVAQVTNRFAPQFSSLASPIGAFVFGGPVGLVASVLLQGGLGFLGGQQGVDSGMKQSV